MLSYPQLALAVKTQDVKAPKSYTSETERKAKSRAPRGQATEQRGARA